MRAAALARHLGVVPSTVSVATKRLSSLGYIARARDDDDRRASSLRLSRQGARAMQAGSVLETRRVASLLARLSADERTRAIDGLELLANAARRMPAGQWRDQ
jgi:DNA-binding MarR family transcriptional regulator